MTQFLVPYEAAKLHMGIKFHFTQEKYDFFRFKGEVKYFTRDKFESNGQNWPFVKLAKKYDARQLMWFYVANIMEKPKQWVGELLGKDCHEVYVNLLGRHEKLQYQFTEDIKKVRDHCDGDLDASLRGDAPPIVKLLYRKEINVESLLILNTVFGGKLWGALDKQMSDTVLWPKVLLKLKKYEAFLEFDRQKYSDIVKGVNA